MENKKENLNDIKAKNGKVNKFKININSNDIKMQVIDFYNQKLKKMHIIFLVIMLAVFAIMFFSSFSAIRSGKYAVAEGAAPIGLVDSIKQNLFLDIVIIIAGITPYCFLSVIGTAQSLTLVNELALRYATHSSMMITCLIGGVLEIIGVSLCVAIGLYYCRLSTKKNKYYHHSDFGMDDVKMQLYELRKQEDKLKELTKKKEEKARKIEECNIKIPYFNFMILGVISLVIQVLGILIAHI